MKTSDEFAEKYAEMEKEEALIQRKETRRHQSLDKSLDNGWEIACDGDTPEETVIGKEEIQALRNAVARLFG